MPVNPGPSFQGNIEALGADQLRSDLISPKIVKTTARESIVLGHGREKTGRLRLGTASASVVRNRF